MGKEDWYFVVSTLIGLIGLFAVPWKEIFGKVKSAMRSPKREVIMALALIGSLFMSSLGWYKASHLQPGSIVLNVSVYDPPYPAPMQIVSDAKFEDQDVPLDGYIYERCTFKNICFLYDGGAFGLHNSTVIDHWKLCVKDQRMKNQSTMLDALKLTIRPSTEKSFPPKR